MREGTVVGGGGTDGRTEPKNEVMLGCDSVDRMRTSFVTLSSSSGSRPSVWTSLATTHAPVSGFLRSTAAPCCPRPSTRTRSYSRYVLHASASEWRRDIAHVRLGGPGKGGPPRFVGFGTTGSRAPPRDRNGRGARGVWSGEEVASAVAVASEREQQAVDHRAYAGGALSYLLPVY